MQESVNVKSHCTNTPHNHSEIKHALHKMHMHIITRPKNRFPMYMYVYMFCLPKYDILLYSLVEDRVNFMKYVESFFAVSSIFPTLRKANF